jgi:hypothetical protein
MSIRVVRRYGIEKENVASDKTIGNVSDIGLKSKEDDIQSYLESGL